ncbi:cytochrome b-c1 complex subunit 8 [Schistocerca americana]|nr:cytochrome b-c1 complex subunit 8 [Schistocerca americana]XP_047113504.1 cytochrome b-c1 complex subunit 8 isoform X2 [Schistocerca piceifrons]XP_049779024.1 cytochrome b-c1 complex subunit 8 [Schistocerca cancellata]XP_049809796.1 cytochrome b-c1 complex subunit 8 [Schistocerca nitens]XP_049862122.1 cytochrome b-c1 complex subunit 8 [Schistocerca gregaria]XP_049956628.1 cytochrome b-c1 complex subunit 8 [Schistocerca serialis cubense]
MGKHFGELAKVRGIIHYRLSPFEQRAFAGILSGGLPNLFNRIRDNIFRVAPPFIIGYLVYDFVEKKHLETLKKNPADFENDE